MKSRILILTFSDISSDARIQRQIRALKDTYELVICAKGAGDSHYDSFIPAINSPLISLNTQVIVRMLLVPFVLVMRYVGWCSFQNSFGNWLRYWSVRRLSLLNLLKNRGVDLIIANDLDTLPIAIMLKEKTGCKVIFDAHEYYLSQYELSKNWTNCDQKYIKGLCDNYLKKADVVLTVSQGLLDMYKKHFNISCLLVYNAPFYRDDLLPISIKNEKIKLVHIGAAGSGRRIEEMIDMSRYLDERFVFDFYLIANDKKYFENLKRLARNNNKVNIYEGVPLNEILDILNKYDMGIFIAGDSTRNLFHCMPNKLFDYIQARIGVGVGPAGDMKSLVERYSLGVVSSDFTAKSLAFKLNKLSGQEIFDFKNNSHIHAYELSFEKSRKLLMDSVRSLVGSK